MPQQPPPMPQPQAPTALMCDPRKTDDDHRRILAVMHFVMAGFAVLGLVFIGAHFAIMDTVFGNPEMWKNQQGSNPPPEEFFAIFSWMYLFMAVMILAVGVGNGLSGLYLRKKKNRMFSMVIAGVNCLNMPLGMALGVFTFIVLSRDSVREAYGESIS